MHGCLPPPLWGWRLCSTFSRGSRPWLLTCAALRLGGTRSKLAKFDLRRPSHGRLKKRFAARRFLRVRAEADDAAFAKLSAGDGGCAFHDAGRSVVFPHFSFKCCQWLV